MGSNAAAQAERRQWRQDAGQLAEIGRYLATQDVRITVRLPRDLADDAMRAWERDDCATHPDIETPQEASERHRAGEFALIGLAIAERGKELPTGEIEVAVDAWQIAAALEAQSSQGLFLGDESA